MQRKIALDLFTLANLCPQSKKPTVIVRNSKGFSCSLVDNFAVQTKMLSCSFERGEKSTNFATRRCYIFFFCLFVCFFVRFLCKACRTKYLFKSSEIREQKG